MPKIKDVTAYLELDAPLHHQENYDNSGLLVGDRNWEVKGILTTLDCTEDVIAEAIQLNCNLVVAHHPIIFAGLKSLTGKNYVERTVIKAIKNDVAIYAIHTNLDNSIRGVNSKICDILTLTNRRILQPKQALKKLVTFVPSENVDQVLQAMHRFGAGNIGNYKECAFTVEGIGMFTPDDEANPSLGKRGNKEKVEEVRVEVLVDSADSENILDALREAHPYEEVAYYLTSIDNLHQEVGAGMIGELEVPMGAAEFMRYTKDKMNLTVLRHTNIPDTPIKRVAICGGSGSFLIQTALHAGADVFITSDIKYHEFFDAENKMLVLDIGHYESEVFTKELLHDRLCKKFTTFAVNLSKTITNPISYF